MKCSSVSQILKIKIEKSICNKISKILRRIKLKTAKLKHDVGE